MIPSSSNLYVYLHWHLKQFYLIFIQIAHLVFVVPWSFLIQSHSLSCIFLVVELPKLINWIRLWLVYWGTCNLPNPKLVWKGKCTYIFITTSMGWYEMGCHFGGSAMTYSHLINVGVLMERLLSPVLIGLRNSL